MKNDNYLTNKYTLLTGGILGLCVPMANGISVHIIDIMWLLLSVTALTAVGLVKRRHQQK